MNNFNKICVFLALKRAIGNLIWTSILFRHFIASGFSKVCCTVIPFHVGVSDEVIAKNYLEACNGNIEMAISMHMDSSDLASTSAKFVHHSLFIK